MKYIIPIVLMLTCISSSTITNVPDEYIKDIQIREVYKFEKDIPGSDITNLEEKKTYLINLASDENKFSKVLDNYTLSSVIWTYRDYLPTRLHLGNDYESERGSNVYAPLYGYIIKADGSYTRQGWIGCQDGKFLAGGGNEIYMIAEFNNKIYGFIFMHCLDVYVKEGEIVKNGVVIATVGDTGSAKSNHLHLEMFYLGNGDLTDYMNLDYPVDFGVGRGEYALSNNCSKKESAPCILDSRDFIK